MNCPQTISTPEDVRNFFEYLVTVENLDLHPDTDFDCYAKEYSTEQADQFNRLMNACFEVCKAANIDIYGLCNEVTNSH